ncbi:MAG: UDP-N-acetylenolpyruvoylglucosamine reductase [Clostridiales bacterium]|nr:MAG: UDP-N-acetylenolpyruvoylglucosamine reductase [Clostridiales bacterium]
MIKFLTENDYEFMQKQSMKNHTTFKIGGIADLIISPENLRKLSALIAYLRQNNINFFVLGNGSNLLVSDEGLRMPVIKTDKFNFIEQNGTELTVGAGLTNAKVANFALQNGLTGFEFAHGIPGTVGGAVVMNAGAYGEEMSGIVDKTTYVDKNGRIKEVFEEEHDFAYRHSRFESGDVIFSTVLKLKKGNPEEIRNKMDELIKKRRASQPLEMPSAGSVFKRPEGYFTGKLIDDCGLRGYSIGGAKVSEKHSGFIINAGQATAKDVLDLISYIQKTVYDKFGVTLTPEVRYVG